MHAGVYVYVEHGLLDRMKTTWGDLPLFEQYVSSILFSTISKVSNAALRSGSTSIAPTVLNNFEYIILQTKQCRFSALQLSMY